MKHLLMLAALLLTVATSYANPTHRSDRADPAATAAAGWVVSDATCDAAATRALNWREVSRQPMNLEAFSKLAEKFVTLGSQPVAASRFLVCLNRKEANAGLAETLMLHQSRLQQPEGVRAAFLHYVINTGQSPALASEDAAIVRSLYDQYRKSLVLTDGNLMIPTLQGLREYGIKANEERYGRKDVVPATLLGFDERADGYSSRDATWMAELSVLAYWLEKPEEKDSIWRYVTEDQLKAWGYTNIATISDSQTDTSAYLAENGEHLVLAFKGSAGMKDFITDARVKKIGPDWAEPIVRNRITRPEFQIHSGFARALDSVWPQIVAELLEPGRQDKPLWVTGHSLGAALAQLAALRLTRDERTRNTVSIRAVYTFGTPRIGDEDFVEAYDRMLGKRTFPHVNHKDLVTRVPGSSQGFRTTARTGGKQFIESTGHVLKSLRETPDGDTEASIWTDAVKSMRNALRFLPLALQPDALKQESSSEFPLPPPEFNSYSSVYEEGALDEHGSSQYLFKLACCVVAEQLWPIQFKQAGMHVPPPENECRQ